MLTSSWTTRSRWILARRSLWEAFPALSKPVRIRIIQDWNRWIWWLIDWLIDCFSFFWIGCLGAQLNWLWSWIVSTEACATPELILIRNWSIRRAPAAWPSATSSRTSLPSAPDSFNSSTVISTNEYVSIYLYIYIYIFLFYPYSLYSVLEASHIRPTSHTCPKDVPNASYIRPIPYTSYIRPIHVPNTSHIRPIYVLYTSQMRPIYVPNASYIRPILYTSYIRPECVLYTSYPIYVLYTCCGRPKCVLNTSCRRKCPIDVPCASHPYGCTWIDWYGAATRVLTANLSRSVCRWKWNPTSWTTSSATNVKAPARPAASPPSSAPTSPVFW